MTELIWDGKYIDGKRQSPVRVALPFQTIETVNESAADRLRTLDLFAAGRQTEWRNRLIWGDKKYVLPSLLPEFAGKVNLIYIDPPFDTGADFSFSATIPNHPDSGDEGNTSFTKEPSIIEQKAYRDTWGRGLDSYLEWFYETALLLHELLHDSGSLYVHLDWHVGHYAKVVLDEVFGQDNFRNELIWHYPGREMHISNKFNAKHDVILFYARTESAKIDMSRVALPYNKDERLKGLRRKVHKDPDGREWVWETRGQASGQEPYKRYVDEIISQGRPLSDVWDDLQFLRGNHPERVDYATQKPSWLIERIIKASSSDGDLVLDCFVGSGTTAAVAETLNRHWIACDLGRFAIHTARKRLLSIPNVKPFIVQNLGKYERQAWQIAEFRADGAGALEEQRLREAAYRKFILDLYHAKQLSGQSWLHGLKAGRAVHVGAVDAPVTLADVKAVARETWKLAGSGGGNAKAAADILGWEFAFELNETARQVAAESRVDVAFKKIPHEVLEKKAVDQGDIKFFELGALSVEPKQKGRELTLKLTDFLVPIDDVPEEARKAIKHWSQMIDYWAVDWDFKEDTFHNQWQSYRTRQETDLELSAKYEYAEPGSYRVVVKVIDILGNDTTKTLEVRVR
jgi:DNA modification methylase